MHLSSFSSPHRAQKDPALRLGASELQKHPWLHDPVHDAFNVAEWLAANALASQ